MCELSFAERLNIHNINDQIEVQVKHEYIVLPNSCIIIPLRHSVITPGDPLDVADIGGSCVLCVLSIYKVHLTQRALRLHLLEGSTVPATKRERGSHYYE